MMDLKHSNGLIGFVFVYECLDSEGRFKWRYRQENMIPDVGRDYLLNAALLAGSQLSTWYIGLYENARTNVVGDTMATLMADAGEITTYAGGQRLVLTPDALSSGVFSNLGTPAEFDFTSTKTVRGGFVSSVSVHGSVSGTLLSLVSNASPKTVESGETLRVTAGLSLATI